MQSPKAAVVDCFRNFRRDEAFCVRARDGSRLFTSLLCCSSLMRRDPRAGWDYEDVSQCNAVWLAKTHVPASGDRCTSVAITSQGPKILPSSSTYSAALINATGRSQDK